MKVSTKVSNCASCGAVVNPRWGECLSCGTAVSDGQALSVEPAAHASQVHLDESPPVAMPASLVSPVTDKLAITWGAETARLIRWFQSTTPPAERFELQPGVVIADPALWWPTIAADIEDGPRRARGKTGALQADLKRLYGLFGQAPRDPGADHGDDDIEREAIQEFDGGPG